MKKDLTEIICVIDKSGSMSCVKTDAIGGFNQFLDEQKKQPNDANMTVVLFDTEYRFYTSGKNIRKVNPLDDKSYYPSGSTALLDAVGKTIDEVGKRLMDTKEEDRPEKVIFVILTDGQENSSVEYNREQVLGKIKLQTDVYKWQFLFLAAGLDAFNEAVHIGININYVANLGYTGELDSVGYTGSQGAYAGLSNAVSSYRSTGIVKNDWKDAIDVK